MTRESLKRSRIAGVLVLCALPSFVASGAESVRSVDIVEAIAFLEGYRVASGARGADFYDLYSDRAIVHVRIQDHEQGIAFQGRAFKAWGRQLLTEGRAAPDSSLFHGATVEQRGLRLLIRAKRYSLAKCYWDPNYQVGIEREGSSYRIVDERLTTQPNSSCPSTHRVINGSSNTALSAPPDYSPSPLSGGLRGSDTESMTQWHPLSQEELADKAMQLARQLAAARASQTRVNSVDPRDLIGSAPTASPARVDVASELRVTPEP
jgi:hypothetical protein